MVDTGTDLVDALTLIFPISILELTSITGGDKGLE